MTFTDEEIFILKEALIDAKNLVDQINGYGKDNVKIEQRALARAIDIIEKKEMET